MIRLTEEQYVNGLENSAAICIDCEYVYGGYDLSFRHGPCCMCGKKDTVFGLIALEKIKMISCSSIQLEDEAEPKGYSKTQNKIRELREQWGLSQRKEQED